MAARHGLPERVAETFESLLVALALEPDPPTTARSPERALEVHLADSLSGLEIEPLAHAESVADVGAGAGFPGLALAAALPDARFDLIEANARKCEVVERLATAASVANARPVRARVEEWGARGGARAYRAVTARALAPLAVLVEYAAPLLHEGGVLVAWKGARHCDEEAGAAAAAPRVGLEPAEVRRVVPFAGARDRHLHVYKKVRPTPARFPRRAGMARKRPLG